jgi:hypothetical protein
MTWTAIRALLPLSLLMPALVAAAPPTPAALPPAELSDGYPMPKGSPEDQALWQKLVTTQNSVTISRAQALDLMRRLDEARYDLRLADAAARSSGAVADRAKALRARLLDSWNEVFQVLTSQWPVDPRLGCRSERLDLEGAMEATDDHELRRSRAAAQTCFDKMAGAVARMEGANRGLEAVVAEAKAAVVGAGPASPAGPEQGMERPKTPPARATP